MSSTISDSQQDQLSATEAASIDLCCSLCDLDDEELLDAIEQMSAAPKSTESNSIESSLLESSPSESADSRKAD